MRIYLTIILSLATCLAWAQEYVIPLQYQHRDSQVINSSANTTRAGLPFLDDFSNVSTQTNPSLWVESQVYINNTMAVDAPTIGVATFDGLDANGRPYRPDNFSATGFGDSLTSQPINLNSFSSSDSLYISFYVQPQGLAFAPETQDSFFLFLRNASNQWIPYWKRQGTNLYPFQHVLLPITDPAFFHDSFQFRFVNFTSLNLNDDIWHLDYVYLSTSRNRADSIENDIAFSQRPTSLLKNYRSMPYRHFISNISNELNSQQEIWLNNLYNSSQNIVVNRKVTELTTSTPISASSPGSLSIAGRTETNTAGLSFPISFIPGNANAKVIMRSTYSFTSPSVTERKQNDTLVDDLVFDNYFAYDDGTAELAYFLNPALNQASRTAVKFTLHQADTIRGLSVFFAPQVPSSLDKYFSIVLYDSLANYTNTIGVLHSQDLFQVQYPVGQNEFTTYAFDQAQVLNAGTYYIGITQPANFGSDSIYYGLDVNNNTNINVLSYNVNGLWYNSSAQGSIMMRPLVGSSFIPTGLDNYSASNTSIIFPNPSSDRITIECSEGIIAYEVMNMEGKIIFKGNKPESIQMKDLIPGIYIVKVITAKNRTETHKLWKR